MPELNFNLLAPTAELYSGPDVKLDPMAAYEAARTRRDTNTLAQLYAKHYDPQTGGVNYNALIPEAAQSGVDVSKLMDDVQKQAKSQADIAQTRALQQQEEAAAGKSQAETKKIQDEQRHEDINRAIRDVSAYTNKPAAMQGIEQKFEEGKIDQEAYDRLMNMVRSEPLWARSQSRILQSLLSEKEKLEMVAPKPEKVDIGGSLKMIDMNPNSETYMQEVKSFTKTPEPAAPEKPMTEAQKLKLKSAKAEDIEKYNAFNQTYTDLANLRDQLIGNPETGKSPHPGLDAITGWSAVVHPEKIPDSEASAASTILETIKGKVKALGRQIASVHGKLGNMAVQEWQMLSDSVQNINPKAKDFPDQINNIVAAAEQLERNSRGRFQYEYDEDVPVLSPPDTGKAQTPPAAGSSNIPTVTTQKQYDALPKGAQFYEDGKLYRKP